MSALDDLPLRDRPTGLPVPPARMALLRDRRPLKHWRYLGLYGEDMMLCAAQARIAGLPQAFWATWDRRRLRERTVFRPGGVVLRDDHARFGPVDLRLEPDGAAIAVTSRHGDSYIWTRKQPVRATGTVDGRPVALRGLIDDSAGYHARRTDWRWCAGVGETPDGAPLAFNVVAGVHDAPQASERTVWIDGTADELPPATFADDLSAVTWTGEDAAELRFAEEARRARADDFKLLASEYVQPFGTFAGTLPGGIAVARGWGVMERHAVRW
ncbi:MAG TPA: DUF2804 family protein [Baekduia sp.]|uniref:DUF2804 family protein n=1 Tax=Baekduia sp. TaxID=2600305 RepID=UPI002CE64574|nr:DUF2804 family protein [Baekduia sp.]HMJ34685.1 DUF2804 family protein [Baekduia sp.]